MGLWSNFKASMKKSSELKRITQVLGTEPSFEPATFMRNAEAQKGALEELLTLIESDPTLVPIMKHYGATRHQLQAAYRTLCLFGGQWEKGHWVPASALCFQTTLPYVLVHGGEKDESVWMEVGERLIEYYRTNSMKPIAPIKATGITRY